MVILNKLLLVVVVYPYISCVPMFTLVKVYSITMVEMGTEDI